MNDFKDAPAVMSEEADTPTEKQIRDWAEQYVESASAKAFASHVWNEWDEYELEGDVTVGVFLGGAMRQWRGEDSSFPPTPLG